MARLPDQYSGWVAVSPGGAAGRATVGGCACVPLRRLAGPRPRQCAPITHWRTSVCSDLCESPFIFVYIYFAVPKVPGSRRVRVPVSVVSAPLGPLRFPLAGNVSANVPPRFLALL